MMDTLFKLFICSVLLTLVGCGNDGSYPNNPPPDSGKTYTVELQWDPPLEYVDDTPIDYIKQYRVYYGLDPNFLKQEQVLTILDGTVNSATLSVPKGIWYFSVTAIADNDLESDLSNIVTYTFN